MIFNFVNSDTNLIFITYKILFIDNKYKIQSFLET